MLHKVRTFLALGQVGASDRRMPVLLFVTGAFLLGAFALLPSGSPSTTLALHDTPCADLNGDGVVSLPDQIIEAGYDGQTIPPAPLQADMDGDTDVDTEDLNFVMSKFGQSGLTCQDKPIDIKGTVLNVTRFDDPPPNGCAGGDCSLREAIIDANASGGYDKISLPAGKYTLTIAGAGEDAAATGDLDITDDAAIIGDSAATTIVDGGALDTVFHVSAGTTATIAAVTITNGSGAGVAGGIWSQGTLLLSHVAVTGNQASGFSGGILNSTGGTMIILSSTISNNTAAGSGGGIRNGGTGSLLTITNSTISGNVADGGGGGILQDGAGSTLELSNVTIIDNTANADEIGSEIGGGMAACCTKILRNTIIAGNTNLSGTTPDCTGGMTSQGYNLIGDNTGCPFTAATGDQVGTGGSPINTLFGPLGDNGGATQTHSVPFGSPAVDAGNPAAPGSENDACEVVDQRDDTRPVDGNSDAIAICDIGAVEFVGVSDCPIDPDLPPPDAGCTVLAFVAILNIFVPSLDPINPLNCTATGAALETRGPVGEHGGDPGLDDVEMEVIDLNGWIDCPGPLSGGSSIPSIGLIEEVTNNQPGVLEFPATQEFVLCLEADTTTPLGMLLNCPEGATVVEKQPLQWTCTLPSLALAECDVVDVGGYVFFDEAGEEVATVNSGSITLVEMAPPPPPPPPPTPTLPPPPGGVGGIAELPDVDGSPTETADSSGSAVGILATIVGAATAFGLALGSAAWYARRRWLS